MITELESVLMKNKPGFHPVVEFNPQHEKLFHFDFTSANTELSVSDISDTTVFSQYFTNKLKSSGSKYGIGGYNEDRVLYRRSELFSGEEPRSIHLGIDIWGPAGTKVYAPLGGVIHSFAFNDNFGDYGATIILLHQLDRITFYTLYGHLSLPDIVGLNEGSYVIRGQEIGHFGEAKENGNWPPHLHFQVIKDMRERKGDYPGVCALRESKEYLANCPDADLVLDMMKYL